MKKILLAIIFTLLTFTTATALDAKVISVTGNVELQRGSSWVTLKQGDTLQKGAVISTGFNSSASLSINNTTVNVGALTRVTLEQLAQNSSKDSTQLYLDSGKVQADVKHTEDRRSDFKVRTPVATASVRGTQIQIYAGGTFSVLEGMADYGTSESSGAEIQGEIAETENATTQSASTVFTSAQEVGGSYGIPVYAGWSSETDSITGLQTSPQDMFAKDSQTFSSNTTSLAASETSGMFTTDANFAQDKENVPLATIKLYVTLVDE